MKNRKMLLVTLVGLVCFMMLSPLGIAQTDSLVVWENIANGTLTSTWTETSNANWKGQNASGIWSYNNTATASLNWTYNASITGSRWMQTWEATCDDPEGGIGSAMFIDSTHYYAVIYYLSFNGTDPAIYIIYYNAGTVSYWDTTPGSWTTNMSNATDYTNYEKDYQNDWVRFKAIWNWNEQFDNCTVRFKAWETTGDEFPLWLCDTVITAVAPTTSTYPGLVVDKRWDLDASTTLFRRIWFWNLSYTMTVGLNHVIDCPTVSINTILTTFADAEDPDLWNTTQLYKDMINLFDLTSFYEESFFMQPANQNDTIYVFSMMLTDMDDFWDMYFPAPPDELPDNVLIFHIYETIDGSDNTSDDFLIRWDTDNDGTYESTDVAMWTNDTLTMYYNGWTPVDAPDVPEYVVMSSGASTSTYAGEVFRDALYWHRVVLINWDNMYNGSSGNRIGDDECRMSMVFYDNNTDNIAVLQDFYPGDDDSHYVNTDGRNKSCNPVWYQENDSSFWTLFNADTTITGEPLSDPEDPVSVYDNLSPATTNILRVILPMLLAVFILVLIIGVIFTMGLTKESLISLMIVVIFGIILIQIILGL
jgi:hypothetical protein